MTSMQVEYNKLVETRRHNLAEERLKSEANTLTGASISEQARHNLQTEALTQQQLQETIRHQTAQDAETMRHNGATEAEINRHNKAMEAQAVADNQLKWAIAKLDSATSKEINAAKLENERYLKQQQLDYQRNADALDRALTRYKIQTENALKSQQLGLDRQRLSQEAERIKNDLTKINADIENNIRKTALEYAKNPAAAALAESMMAGKALTDEGSTSAAASKIVEAIMSENNLSDVREKDSKWWEKAIDIAISNGKSTTVFGFTERIKEIDAIIKWLSDSEGDGSMGGGSYR